MYLGNTVSDSRIPPSEHVVSDLYIVVDLRVPLHRHQVVQALVSDLRHEFLIEIPTIHHQDRTFLDIELVQHGHHASFLQVSRYNPHVLWPSSDRVTSDHQVELGT